MTRLQIHLPEITMPDTWRADQRSRVQRAIERAIERAMSTLQRPGVSITVVPGSAPAGKVNGAKGPQRPASRSISPRERIDASRVRQATGTLHDTSSYGVPSYDDGGAEVKLPLKERNVQRGSAIAGEPGTAPAQAAGGTDVQAQPQHHSGDEMFVPTGDRILSRPFQRIAVLRRTGNNFVFAGGSPHVRTGNLARAMQWGNLLFGGLGFAVLAPSGDRDAGEYVVAPLTEPLSIADLGGLGAQVRNTDVQIVKRHARLLDSHAYTTVTVVTQEPVSLHRLQGNTLQGNTWTFTDYQQALVRSLENSPPISTAEIENVTRQLLSQRQERDNSMVEFLVNMDRTLFAAMPWEDRARYLEALIDARTGDREKIAILEIVAATRNQSELEAIFATVRRLGLYAKLFDDLDSHVFSLLQTLGEYRPQGALSWTYLVDLLLELNLLPGTSILDLNTDPIRQLERLAGGVLDWLSGTWESIVFLLTEPGKVLEGLQHLAEFLWVIEKARRGDEDAQAFLAQLVRHAGAATVKAIHGMEYAEVLGTDYNQRGRSAKIGGDIIGRLRVVLIIECLSWFVELGEVKAAVRSADLTQRLSRLAGLLRKVGRAGEAAQEAGRLERLLQALAELANLSNSTQVRRLLPWLPEAQTKRLTQLAEAVEVPKGSTLRRVLEHDATMVQVAEELGRALRIAERLESRAAKAGGVTADMVSGLDTLLRHMPPTWSVDGVLRLIDDVPTAHLDDFLRTLMFIDAQRLSEWPLDMLRGLAQHPQALAFVREVGSDLVENLFQRAGTWEGFERLVDAIAIRRTAIGDPAAYRRWLDRLRNGDPTSFDKLMHTVLRDRGHQNLLDELLDGELLGGELLGGERLDGELLDEVSGPAPFQ